MSDSSLLTQSDKRIPIPELVRRYASGESIQVLAAESGVKRQTIYEWMLSELGDEEYQSLVTKALIRRISEADEKLENAPMAHDIARAREMARFARMDFERRRPKLYGPKQEIDIDKRVTVHVHRDQAPQAVVVEGQVIEGDACKSLNQQARTLPTQERASGEGE